MSLRSQMRGLLEQFDLTSVWTRLEHLIGAASDIRSTADEVRSALLLIARTEDNEGLASAAKKVEEAHNLLVQAGLLLQEADKKIGDSLE